MSKNEIKEISDRMFQSVSYFVILQNFKLEVYNITNDMLNTRLVMIDDGLAIMNNFISYIFNKIITQIIIRSTDKTIKVFVREKELEND